MRSLILTIVYPFALLLDSKLRKSKVPLSEFISMNSPSFKQGRYLFLSVGVVSLLLYVSLTLLLPLATGVVGSTVKQTGKNLAETVGDIHQAKPPEELTHSPLQTIVTKANKVEKKKEPESTPVDETLSEQDERMNKMRERFKGIGENKLSNKD